MTNYMGQVKGLGLVISGAIIFSTNSAIAQIIPDGTLPTNSQVNPEVNNVINIEGGTKVDSNLFHSFEQFSVLDGKIANFKNPENVQNIITRVTGKSNSNIEGTLKADYTANLFLINPNGISFGPNASLQIGGSFVASTASSVNFKDGTKFSATHPQNTPLLTVSVPIGLQFGTNAASISNESQAKDPNTNLSVGLQVKPGKTLALVGGEIILKGGRLRAESGRIELGSVASNSVVSLKPIEQGWALGYDGVENFQDIQLISRRTETSDGADIPSVVNATGDGGGSIQVQGKIVTISGAQVGLFSTTTGDTNGQDITITAQKFIVENGAQVRTSSRSDKDGGHLTINASESVELIDSLDTENTSATGLFTTTTGKGNAGNISIYTKKLYILSGASLTTESSSFFEGDKRIQAEGNAGNITVNALEMVEIAGKSTSNVPSRFSASTVNSTKAGIVNITTGKLIVRDGAEINVSVYATTPKDTTDLATPGEINITARSILLNNEGKITAQSESGRGGNITLQVQDLLQMRRQSKISASAGTTQAPGDGGNITINAPNGFIGAGPLENNDITANAYSGSGGNIKIQTKSIFGFVPRTAEELERLLKPDDLTKLDSSELPTSDVTAFSQQNRSLSGSIQINTPEVDPSKGLIELPVNLVDVSQQIATDCKPGGKLGRGSFIVTGRGGIAPSPRQPLMSNDALRTDWLKLGSEPKNRAGGVQNRAVIQQQRYTEDNTQKVDIVNNPTEIIQAQGWVFDTNGNVVLVAQAPIVTPHSPSLTSPSCAVK
ncbi:two-partner secretion domain-containing protein [Cylindrospermum sp. FACHB-282]|uniref:two-partner secretion domain-containing protein n=1 Tax=Cylindrospermum sp. FACHB-282 TaxID=2692794 RepID=UPI00168720AE|nr:filamentous hemagglutinin N-terminal domain-containing protein [Cylindrospermum sp. FACHB-282]MBD2388136.1 filamentous hemagglutinin N-terminal domain-containing protein [Cylindrospermum sp. FACHB-282]